jgi:pSer/pThr/pTyr-binding forkhead associated (FHA) protein/multidrug resistance efflux pump
MQFGEVRIIYPDGHEETMQLTKATVRLGRSVEGNDIVLVDSQVSRRHAELQCSNQSIQVMDLGSGNGVWVDGVRITPHIPVGLADGSTFAIGRVRFVVQVLSQNGKEVSDGGATTFTPPSALLPTTAVKSSTTRSQPAEPPQAADAAMAKETEPPPAEPATPSTPVVVTAQQTQIPTTVDPVDVDIEAGEAKTFVVTIVNRTERVDAAVLHIEGVPQEWITIRPIAVSNDQGVRNDRPTPTTSGGVSLLPGYIGELHATILPPRLPSSRAGDRTCTFHTAFSEQPQVTDQVETTITIKPFVQVISNLVPEQQNARLRGSYMVEVDNQGNCPVDIDLSGRDREDILSFDFQPKRPSLAEGTQAIVHMRARSRNRQLFGTPHNYRFTITSSPAGALGQARQHQGELTLRWLPLWPFILLLGLALVALLVQPLVDILRPINPIRIHQGPITDTLNVSGRVASPEIATFAFERDGVVESILPAGTLVNAGQELAHLRYYEQLRAIRLAEDNLKQAQLQLDLARRQHQQSVDAAQLELDKAKAAAKRLAAGGPNDPARSAQRTLAAAERDQRNASADASIVKLKAEDQVAQATIAVQEAQQKLARAQWEWNYVQEHHTDPNFVPEVTSNNDAGGADTGGSQTEAPKLNDVQEQAFLDNLNTATRTVSETTRLLTAAMHDLDRARAVEITANDGAAAGVQTAQEQLDAIKKGEQTPEQVAAQDAIDAAQLKIASLSDPDLTVQLKAVADAEHALEDARDKLALGTIKAPMSGRVVSTSVITGAIVQQQAPIIQLALGDLDQIEADLTDDQLQHIAPAQQFIFTLYAATSSQTMTGQLARVQAPINSPAAAPTSASAGQPGSNHVRFRLASPISPPGTIGDLARLQGSLILHPGTLWVEPQQIQMVNGQPMIWLRRVIDIGIAKIPHDRTATVTLGVASAKQVEILAIAKPDHLNLQLCQAQETNGSSDVLSNRDIPNDCWVIVAPPTQ